MRIGRGRAFLMGDDSESCPVCKEWNTIEGRQFLIEEVPVSQIAPQLQALPAFHASLSVSNSVVNVVSKKRMLPPRPLANVSGSPMKITKLANPKPGFVIDYFTLNTTLTNYTFQAGQTYYFSGNVGLYGTVNTFDGAAVLKYASGMSLTVNTPVNWQAGPYRPVVMVAKDDNTVGESISTSTGNPGSGYYATKALYFDGTAAFSSLNITNLRILNAKSGVVINGSSGHTLNDLQLVKCGNGVAATNTDFALHNALFEQVLTNFTGTNATGNVEQLTVDTATWLNKNIGANLNLTNCLLVAITNLGSCNTQSVVTLSSSNGVFQIVGGGGYYLATNSPYRNAGTTNISLDTIAALAHKTTYPPIVCVDTNITNVTAFSPVIQRDNDIPDLGFHYDPMDYAFSGVVATTNISFTAGTAVGWFCLGSDFYGLSLSNKQIATFNGTVENPDYFARASTVQEGGNGNWPNSWAIVGVIGSADQHLQDVTLSPEWRMQFTTCPVFSSGEQVFRDWGGYLIIRANNSTLIGGNNGGYVLSCYFTNCLIDGMEAGQVEGFPGNAWIMRNCTWRGGMLYMARSHTEIPVSVRDCSFDGTAVSVVDSFSSHSASTDYDYNAYTNATDPFPIGGSHDKTSVSFNWQIGPLGTYYLPSGSVLIDAGDTTADQLGLYHVTTQTAANSQETNSTVDIGYHYVAVDGSGNPLDTDGDGTPDYIEDANGNGVVDSGETDWQSATDSGLKVTITRPKNNSTIP